MPIAINVILLALGLAGGFAVGRKTGWFSRKAEATSSDAQDSAPEKKARKTSSSKSSESKSKTKDKETQAATA